MIPLSDHEDEGVQELKMHSLKIKKFLIFNLFTPHSRTDVPPVPSLPHSLLPH